MNLSGTVVFAAGESGSYKLYTLNLESLDIERITSDKASYDYPRWSPCGKKILCVRRQEYSPPVIWLMSADGSNGHQIGEPGIFYHQPNWHPSGKTILFSANIDDKNDFDLYEMGLDRGAKPRRLTGVKGTEASPELSADAKRLLFSSSKDGNDDIYLIELESDNWIQLTSHPAHDYCPRFSPDGSKIAFVSERDAADGSADADLYIMNADGSDIRQLTQSNYSDKQFCWSPCGNYILYVKNTQKTSGGGRLALVAIDGSKGEKEIDYTRDVIEADLGASPLQNIDAVPFKGLRAVVEALGRSTLSKDFFGSERFPDWKNN